MLVYVYLMLTIIFWGWSFVATKILLEYVTPVELMGLRLIIGLPILYAVILSKGIKLSFASGHRWHLLLGSAILTAHFLIQINGLVHTSATNTGWIIAVTPLVMAVAAFVFLKEKIGFKEMVGIAIATAGIVLLVSKGKIGNLDWIRSVGDWLILASAHTWALYTVATRDLVRGYNPLAVTFAVLLPSAIILVGYMTFTSDWGRFLSLPSEPLLALLFLGIFSTAVAHWFWQEGVSKLGAARAGIFLYLEPLATTSLAVPYLNEQFGLLTAVGGTLVLGGVFVAQRKPVRVPPK
ncbi:MAG: DMT family transporter [Candidatus Zixiibacteriota bacterium]|nr:MAG: DMT family transporter [candidate division Zixibacteria bacterium]